MPGIEIHILPLFTAIPYYMQCGIQQLRRCESTGWDQERNVRKQVMQALGAGLRRCWLKLPGARRYEKKVRRKKILNRLAQLPCNPQSHDGLVQGVIFSMDRACQLHALLTSFFDNVEDEVPVSIIYKASDARHARAYDEVMEEFSGKRVTWVKEDGFSRTLRGIVDRVSTRLIFFLVDDIVFIRPVRFTDFADCDMCEYVPSLRLGTHLNYCYTKQQTMKLPDFGKQQIGQDRYYSWKWSDGELDWGYPLSVDGHIFLTEEIKAILDGIVFNAPNSLERGLQLARDYYLQRSGLCYGESRIVNIPANRVQDEIKNIHGDMDAAELLEKWEDNFRIDVGSLYRHSTVSVHQELPLHFIRRT